MTDKAPATWREVGFRKSSFSGSNGGNCVEVTRFDGMFGVRDSKNSIGPVLALSAEQGNGLLFAIKCDHFTK